MVGRSLSPAFTLDDARSFVNDVKEAFGADETAKYREFLDILQGLRANRIDYPTLVATVEELLKDHQDLLLRFNAFFAVEPNEPPKPAFDDAVSYIDTVREAFHDEPAKYREFIKILNDARRGDSKGRVCERVKRVLKGHPNLLRGFRVFVPARSTITIASTKSEQRAASDNNKRIRVANFITKLKARFQGNDRHVYESFLEILTMYQEGNKSVNDLYQEVIALLQGHEDLVMEFEDVLKKPTDPSGSKSARDR
ncbi:paired amphipathic helix protein Sin3-like 6 [Arabidopsis lyrata subsp. lyrata]|uniref:paired amphipathic helix protein Sin3-like 6 n=1 Tax=Arabidopsis lyrata subsp. lyrata TaxID=81972 RepID=UPI000A29DB9A|nr:paired amphipathic helix protein Sin3-like 6 [Arabidopsis lyrata subsp. lyrata]|eukprot:XP_020869750.1 paired amphipathic helix protein Sin3-like 6 [Arabidopsis lyrata subsp. lyrata]